MFNVDAAGYNVMRSVGIKLDGAGLDKGVLLVMVVFG